MTSWEYKIISTSKSLFTGKDKENVDDVINSFGKDGWELISVVPDTMTGTISGYIFFFKRQRF